MVIWSRWGILGLIIPIALNLLIQEVLEPHRPEAPMPVKDLIADDESEDFTPEEEIEASEAAQRQREDDDVMVAEAKRAENMGFFVAYLIGGGALWPLGQWLNTAENRSRVDPETGQPVELQSGARHTLFFIPLQYWAFVWPTIGLYKLVS